MPTATRTFLRGRTCAGALWIEKPDQDESDIICVTEGWATGESIYQATGYAVLMAIDTGNLLTVAQWAHERYPDHKVILCADDDHKTPSNPGLTKAKEAARAIDALVAVPTFGDDRKDEDTDFNDMWIASGDDAVKAAIDAASAPEEQEADE